MQQQESEMIEFNLSIPAPLLVADFKDYMSSSEGNSSHRFNFGLTPGKREISVTVDATIKQRILMEAACLLLTNLPSQLRQHVLSHCIES